jgi:hypothetical protein
MNSRTKITRTNFLWICLGIFLFRLQYAEAQTVVVPNNLSTTYGGAFNVVPFDIGVVYLSSMRYQQMYDASQFTSVANGGEYITQINFRAASIDGAFSTTLQNIQFNLTTTANPSLNSTFADNIGIDDTTVFSGSWSFSSASAGPSVFDIVLNLTTPFFYNPVNGNLVLDIKNFGGGDSVYFDDAYNDGGVTRAYSGDVSDPSAEDSDNEGLVTQFTFSPVPEPTSVLLITIGSLVFVAWRKRTL